MRQRIRVAAAHVVRAFLWPAIVVFRLWTVVARVICALQTWSAEVLANDADDVSAQSPETAAPSQPRGKILPFRPSRIA